MVGRFLSSPLRKAGLETKRLMRAAYASGFGMAALWLRKISATGERVPQSCWEWRVPQMRATSSFLMILVCRGDVRSRASSPIVLGPSILASITRRVAAVTKGQSTLSAGSARRKRQRMRASESHSLAGGESRSATHPSCSPAIITRSYCGAAPPQGGCVHDGERCEYQDTGNHCYGVGCGAFRWKGEQQCGA